MKNHFIPDTLSEMSNFVARHGNQRESVITPTELAYVAGFLDGEGTFGVYRRSLNNPNWSPSFALNIWAINRDYKVIFYLQDLFGGHVRLRTKKQKAHHSFTFSWRASTSNSAEIAKLLLPYLRIKREAAQVLIDFSENVMRQNPCYGKSKQRLTDAEIAKREAYYDKTKFCNSKCIQTLPATTKYGNPVTEMAATCKMRNATHGRPVAIHVTGDAIV